MSGLKLAVWSGPRNISTAMMRSWGNRPDTAVIDEPLYANYLLATGIDHPGRDEIIAAGETNWRRVVRMLTGPIPGGRAIWYQKHMTHHMRPALETDWFADLKHAFLIRDPREVILSYAKTRPSITSEDIGVMQQVQLYERIRSEVDPDPVVIDAGEFLRRPEAHLRAWCERLGVEFLDAMLSWPAGPRDTDGVWAPYWYEEVQKSTGFAPWHPRNLEVPQKYRKLVDANHPLYALLYAKRLRI
jgi:hypothetical protein